MNKLYGKKESYIAYKRARNPTKQIRILSQLNNCTIDDMVVVIGDEIKKERNIKCLEGKELDDYLFRVLDLLDRALSYKRVDKAELEEFYQQTVNMLIKT